MDPIKHADIPLTIHRQPPGNASAPMGSTPAFHSDLSATVQRSTAASVSAYQSPPLDSAAFDITYNILGGGRGWAKDWSSHLNATNESDAHTVRKLGELINRVQNYGQYSSDDEYTLGSVSICHTLTELTCESGMMPTDIGDVPFDGLIVPEHRRLAALTAILRDPNHTPESASDVARLVFKWNYDLCAFPVQDRESARALLAEFNNYLG